jgi:hypothetical protein
MTLITNTRFRGLLWSLAVLGLVFIGGAETFGFVGPLEAAGHHRREWVATRVDGRPSCLPQAPAGHFLTVSAPDCPSQSRHSMRERNGWEVNVPESQFAINSMAENGETSGRRSVIM